MLVGSVPWSGKSWSAIFQGLKSFERIDPPAGVSEEAADLLRNLLQKDAASRLLVCGALTHPWCKLSQKTLSELLVAGEAISSVSPDGAKTGLLRKPFSIANSYVTPYGMYGTHKYSFGLPSEDSVSHSNGVSGLSLVLQGGLAAQNHKHTHNPKTSRRIVRAKTLQQRSHCPPEVSQDPSPSHRHANNITKSVSSASCMLKPSHPTGSCFSESLPTTNMLASAPPLLLARSMTLA